MNMWIQYVLYLVILVLLAIPLGNYIKKVMEDEYHLPFESRLYKILKIEKEEQMSWKKYLSSVLIFSFVGFLFLFFILLFQHLLPMNPQRLAGIKWDLAFNTAISFVTNTNWQAYSGENSMSYFSQSIGFTVQNFVSAASGIAVLFVLIRGLRADRKKALGSFWVDLTRITLYLLLPLNLVISLLLVGGGVIQNYKGAEVVILLEPIALDSEGNILKDVVIDLDMNEVILNGVVLEDAQIVKEQFVPMGLVASQVAIKQTGTNGGGYFGMNSAHPLENPTIFTNMVEMLSLLLIPVALCFTFGSAIKNKKQGFAIFMTMFICLSAALCLLVLSEQATPQLSQNGLVDISSLDQAGGNMEGKESRFGIVASNTWTIFTTAASNGSVNAMLDSYTPIGGMIPLLLIQLGEVIFGGVGSGLYGMIAFVILTVFIAGLLVGRTPEFLGKKIEAYEMKWSVLICLATPIAILIGSGIAALLPSTINSLNNTGAHGFTEMLYAFSSAGGNNGSAFAGFNGNTIFLNLSLGMVMLVGRFLPIIGTLAIANSLSTKKHCAITSGTLSTTSPLFVFLLIFVVILIGALSFLPALSLGPLAEFFSNLN